MEPPPKKARVEYGVKSEPSADAIKEATWEVNELLNKIRECQEEKLI